MSHFALPQPHTQPPQEAVTADPVTVGVFDSGVGGLTVVRALLAKRPDVNLVYFADSLNLPYGGRHPEQLVRFGHSNIEFLLSRGANVLAVGCNTTSSVMGQGDLKTFGVPVFDLVGSTLDWLRVQHGRPHKLGILGTWATIYSGYWERRLRDAYPDMQLFAEPCPEFVPLVEDPDADPQAIRYAVHERLRPLLDEGVRTVLHACTHYPWLQHQMSEVEPELHFIDPAHCLAERLCASLAPAPANARPGKYQLFSSRPSQVFYRLAGEALGRDARDLTRMFIVNPYED